LKRVWKKTDRGKNSKKLDFFGLFLWATIGALLGAIISYTFKAVIAFMGNTNSWMAIRVLTPSWDMIIFCGLAGIIVEYFGQKKKINNENTR